MFFYLVQFPYSRKISDQTDKMPGNESKNKITMVREGCKIEKRLNLGHSPTRRAGGLKECPSVPTLILT